MNPLLLAGIAGLAFLGGFVGSMMSGGSLVVFFILTLLGLPVKAAVGTLKMVIAGLTLVSSLEYLRAGVLEVRFASALIASACAGAYIGSSVFLTLPDELARLTVAVFLLVGSYFTLRGKATEEPVLRGLLSQIIAGLALGFYIAILGEASTLVTITALGLFFRLDILRANATAKLLIFFTNLVAFAGYARGGSVEFTLGLLLLVPVALGSWLGARTAVRIGGRALKAIFLSLVIATLIGLLGTLP